MIRVRRGVSVPLKENETPPSRETFELVVAVTAESKDGPGSATRSSCKIEGKGVGGLGRLGKSRYSGRRGIAGW